MRSTIALQMYRNIDYEKLKLISTSLVNSLKSISPSLFSSNGLISFSQSSSETPLSPSAHSTSLSSAVSMKPSRFLSNTSNASFTSPRLGSCSSNTCSISRAPVVSRTSGLMLNIPSLCITILTSIPESFSLSVGSGWGSGNSMTGLSGVTSFLQLQHEEEEEKGAGELRVVAFAMNMTLKMTWARYLRQESSRLSWNRTHLRKMMIVAPIPIQIDNGETST